MGWRERYENAKTKLVADSGIDEANRRLFGEFLAWEEYKLKRQSGLPDLDEGCCKTLYTYIQRLRAANRWFLNKPWRDLTRDDIKRVYDGLEDGTIRTLAGKPVEDRVSYYNKVFKSKPFRMAGKDTLAREIIEFSTRARPPVRFVTEESFRRLAAAAGRPCDLLLLWLAWDIGENIDTLLKLTGRDFVAQANRHSGEREYIVHLAAKKLKRSRQARSEVTLYPETAHYADLVLATVEPDEFVFPRGYRAALKFLTAAVRRSAATTMPDGQPVRWKDLRSGMACHLLRSGWSRDEVNARLGHTPHSATLDAYINFLALDREKPKQRMFQDAAAREHLSRTLVQVGTESLGLTCTLNDGASIQSALASTRRDLELLSHRIESLARLAAIFEPVDDHGG